MTKLILRLLLLKRAYTKPQVETMLTKVPFTKTDIDTTPIGLEVWVER
jgi:hypothetical protein